MNVRLLKSSLFQLSLFACCAVLEPLVAAPAVIRPIRKINLPRPPQKAKIAPSVAASSTRSGFQSTPKVSPHAKTLDFNQNVFPRSSLHSFSGLVDAPAGKHGFLERRGEHFYWPNGNRARFWGINVANKSLQESNANIDRMIANFRHAGFNLIRLHHFDEREGIIDLTRKDSRHFNAARLKKLDYWIYRAKQNGLYIYLDLLNYRRFKEGDGVVNAEAIGRAARPYSLFDPRLIELQKEYARMLLRDHVNPYTKLAYADDPAVVMLEIYNESGLFIKRKVWREMPRPYAKNFQGLWNKWLRRQYGTTAKLQAAWGAQNDGASTLETGENLEDGTVEVPAMTQVASMTASQRVWAKAARRNDGARFAYDVQREYLRQMKTYLRSIGLRIPVTAIGRFDDIPDLRAVAEETDFVSNNFYYDHPYWGAGKPAWTPPSYYQNRNPLAQIGATSLAPALAVSRIKGSPLVVREWNYCWPNENRASGMIEAAAYGALQDIDALILFTYEVMPTPRVFYFNVRSDPARWGLCGIAAQVFLRGLVKPATNRVVVPFNTVDTFSYNEYSNAFY
ncbi:MAG TPA: beta-galactosidase, partial [Abditibacteriaceae bacterium]|nr:beta-galactosidase [Abditibacteriaceae bacterium]